MAYFSRSGAARRQIGAQFAHERLCPICDHTGSDYVFSRNDARFTRCSGCDLVRIEPRKKAQEPFHGVEEISERQLSQSEHAGVEWLPLMHALGDSLRKRTSGGSRVGVDCSMGAEPIAVAARLGIELVVVNPSTPAAPPFDILLIAGWFESKADPLATISAMRRLLAPGGIVALMFETMPLRAGQLNSLGFVAGPPKHFLYTRENAESLLFRAGFGNVAIERSAGAGMNAVVIASKRYPHDAASHRAKLSVVMPVFNEKATFRAAFELLYAKVLPHCDKEIIVVESNSTDGTRDEVRSIASRSGVTVVWQDRPSGKGNAVREGLQRAIGDFVIIQDADLEYDIDDYDLLLDPLLHNRAAFVLGVRHGRHGDSWKMRHFDDQIAVSQMMNFGHILFTGLFNAVYGQRLSDPFTMFKVFRRDCIEGVTFECDRFDFDWELVAKLVRRGYTPVEIPVNYVSRSFAEGKKISFFRDPLTWVRACIKYRFVKV